MSFLDEPDEPVSSRTRRRPQGGRQADRQTLLARRTIAIGAGLIVLILLILGFRGCLAARNETAIKDYVASSAELVDQSKREGNQLFELLGTPRDPLNAAGPENAVNALRSEAATVVDRAQDLGPPDEVSAAHDYLVEALELRRDALAVVARELPGALADQGRRQSSDRIANVMQVFLASDVLLTARFRPRLEDAIGEEGLEGQVSIPSERRGRFLPDIEWVRPDFVAEQIAAVRNGDGATDDTAAPGLHGNGLGTVTLGGVALVPGASATVPLSDDLSFEVQVVNQGESNETDVNVTVSVGQGGDAIQVEEQIPEIAVGEQQNVIIPLGQDPPTGENVPITVEVEPVAGEEKTDNNSAEFTAIFTS